MKKILAVAFVAALAVVMTGCQKEEEKNPVAAAAAAVKSDADKAAKDAWNGIPGLPGVPFFVCGQISGSTWRGAGTCRRSRESCAPRGR